jgi:hypothetical protein
MPDILGGKLDIGIPDNGHVYDYFYVVSLRELN